MAEHSKQAVAAADGIFNFLCSDEYIDTTQEESIDKFRQIIDAEYGGVKKALNLINEDIEEVKKSPGMTDLAIHAVLQKIKQALEGGD